MKVLVVGSGGREHALCETFARSVNVERLYCASGNAGIASVAECVPISPEDVRALADLAADKGIDLTFVGGETPLSFGIVDEFAARGLAIVGPTKKAAMLESSKAFAKNLMSKYGVPTAAYEIAGSVSAAVEVLESGVFGPAEAPVVVKADGLAAGKGVVVARDRAEAIAAVRGLSDLVGGDAASTIVLEECMYGREVSLLMFADGENYSLMPPVRDHKRIGEGDTGPNTGGMGTVTDDGKLLTDDQIREIEETIVLPTLRGCISEGYPFRGILFIGLMMTDAGPRVLEYNVRFGDPETQAVLVRLRTDLLDICKAMLTGRLNEIDIEWTEGSSACVVLAAEGYPARPRVGDAIEGLDEAAKTGVSIFHAGTRAGADGSIVTAGGRVLGISATAPTLGEALNRAYAAADLIRWPGMQYRRDIGK
ncbi:MAG: phosphoribosylamine--glycine ligase [Acidobacteria bacterium]|nr:phosphoribosylamine--glycine ligase [Acidobacteriota bacterium]MCW5948987.1 phosphoribosylamine--glycine ligase [Pyrinomonadaceae bacterium]